MRRSGSRIPALAGVCLITSLLVAPGLARAQDGTGPDPCVAFGGGAADASGACRYGSVPSSQVPVLGDRWGVGDWFTLTDPSGDVRTAAGQLSDAANADIVQGWWRVLKLTGPIIRALNSGEDGLGAPILATNAGIKAGGRFFVAVVQVDGETIGKRPEKETLLLSIFSDPNARPNDDWPARVALPFLPWAGNQVLHQAGQFSTGAFGAGSTDVGRLGSNGQVDYYNAPSGIGLWPHRPSSSYVLVVPVNEVGDDVTIFMQSTPGDEPAYDTFGDIRKIVSSVPIDGLSFGHPACAELDAVDPADVGDGTVNAAFQVRIADPVLTAGMQWLLAIELASGGDRLEIGPIAGQPEGDGLFFDIPLVDQGLYSIVNLDIGPDVDGDGRIDEAGRPAVTIDVPGLLPSRFELGGTFGHLGGSYNCARGPQYFATADGCGELNDNIVQIADLFAMEPADVMLIPAGDDAFATCSIAGPDAIPFVFLTVSRTPVTEEEARTGVIPGLEREGCTMVELTMDAFDVSVVRTCTGDSPSVGLFTLADEVATFFGAAGGSTQDELEELARIESISSDADGDGIPNMHDDDVDGDGIPNGSDLDDDNDSYPDTQDRWPYSAALW